MTHRFKDFDAAFAWLASRTNYETMATQSYDARTYGLARVHRLLDAVGRPDRRLDVLHVVGSKGKGSAAWMAAEILRASGRRTGLYTSPHLVDPRERIVVDGAPVDDALVVAALDTLHPAVGAAADRGEPCTFFEIHTTAALLAFAAAGCDSAVLEAGMGGRLDATTAADARAVALTSLSLDHIRQLGDTIESVAREKAAAVRPGRPFVCGVRAGAPGFAEVEAACADAGGPLLVLGRDFDVRDTRTSFRDAAGDDAAVTRLTLMTGEDALALESPLLGVHQATNAAVAATLVRASGLAVPDAAIRAGIASARPPARLQVIGRAPLTLLDGAHSPASFRALAEAVRAAVPRRPCVLVVGMAADKDVDGALAALAGTADLVVGTTSGAVRAAEPARIAEAARAAGLDARAVADLAAALDEARDAAGRDGLVVVTGSLYLCGAVLTDRQAERG